MLEVVIQILVAVLLPVILIVASWIDLKQHRIPNFLTLSALIAGVSLQLLLQGWSGIMYSLGGMAIGFLICLLYTSDSAYERGCVYLSGV